ncbi:restriction endonuclease subunit S [Acholeplasma equifetale]|uniref:restriction endonuclease subunit S n=1 Tax=Acholeplasma equifetale TaxID=264634 RepID=UPI00068B308A|nr:restriction endonuclease subunit S [Acholeplasma equifetale]
MIAEKLRKAVLQAAMEGKLTEQLDNDSSVYQLITEVHKIDNDYLWEIPKKWAWVKFGDLVDFKMGKTPERANPIYWGNDVPWISIADMNNQSFIMETKEKVSNSALESIFKKQISPKGTLIMSFKLTVGRTSILGIDALHNEAIISIFPKKEPDTQKKYLYFVLPEIANMGETKDAIKGKTLNSKSIYNLLIPLPPIEEQKRIVEKLEVLLAEIDKLEQDEKALKELEDKFPEKLKTSILKSVMEGKLTNQLLNDSKTIITIDKKYAQIQQEQIPYTIPENWKWFRVKELFIIRNGFTPLRSNMDFWNSKDVPWFTVNDIRNQGRVITYTDQYISNLAVTDNKVVPKNSILLCCTASIGEYALTKIDLTTNQQFNGMTIKDKYQEFIDIWFVYYWVQTIKEEMISKAGKTTFPFLSVTKLGDFLIPLPPIEEQKRIVEKLDKLFAIDLLNI